MNGQKRDVKEESKEVPAKVFKEKAVELFEENFEKVLGFLESNEMILIPEETDIRYSKGDEANKWENLTISCRLNFMFEE
jgi:hypothetical protein